MNTSPAAIKNRLLSIAEKSAHPYNYVFERYTQERLLYRLSTGAHAKRFLLKGGLYLTAITEMFARATHDIDFEFSGDNNPDAVQKLVVEAISHDVESDGLEFQPDSTKSGRIREHAEYSGVRITIPGIFGRQQFKVQLDLGFGDAILLPISDFSYPSLIEGLSETRIRAYSKESVLAEKLEAITILGKINGRYKDFDDVSNLAGRFSFHAAALHLACRLTFERRRTNLDDLPRSISSENADTERERHWRSYVGREHAQSPHQTFDECLAQIRTFAHGILQFNADGIDRRWNHLTQTWSETTSTP
jgi:predicted nucleotidyltransferase component of viral defense system